MGLKSRPCIIHECRWISISDTRLRRCWEHLCPHSAPPPRYAAAYGGRRDVACAQLCSGVNREQSSTHALSRALCCFNEDIHRVGRVQSQAAEKNKKGNLYLRRTYTGIYATHCVSCAVSIIPPSSSHSRCSFSLADPISGTAR